MVSCDLEHFELEQEPSGPATIPSRAGLSPMVWACSVSLLPGGRHGKRGHRNADTGKLERAKGFEPSTPTLARSCSTPELHPHPKTGSRSTAAEGQSYAKCGVRMQQPDMRSSALSPLHTGWQPRYRSHRRIRRERCSARQLQYFRAGTNLWVRIVLARICELWDGADRSFGDIRRGSRDHSRARQRAATAGVGSDQRDDDPDLHEGCHRENRCASRCWSISGRRGVDHAAN